LNNVGLADLVANTPEQYVELAAALARLFDVTWTTRAGDKEYFRRSVSLTDLARVLPAMLDSAPGHQRNMTCRIGF
jgi:predicted O-linked N-acetylglucosamine transferase (SPINDLY family)